MRSGRVVQRQVLYLREINDSQQAAWRKTLQVLDEVEQRARILSLFPEDREVPVDALEVVQVKLEEMELRGARDPGTIKRTLLLSAAVHLLRGAPARGAAAALEYRRGGGQRGGVGEHGGGDSRRLAQATDHRPRRFGLLSGRVAGLVRSRGRASRRMHQEATVETRYHGSAYLFGCLDNSFERLKAPRFTAANCVATLLRIGKPLTHRNYWHWHLPVPYGQYLTSRRWLRCIGRLTEIQTDQPFFQRIWTTVQKPSFRLMNS